MLHITSLYASILGILMIFLAFRVANFRKEKQVGLGDNGDSKGMKLIRTHANAVEYIPILLILMAIYEINGGSTIVLNTVGILAVFARFYHAFGLSKSSGYSLGRFIGTIITFILIISLSILNIYKYFM